MLLSQGIVAKLNYILITPQVKCVFINFLFIIPSHQACQVYISQGTSRTSFLYKLCVYSEHNLCQITIQHTAKNTCIIQTIMIQLYVAIISSAI